MRRLPKGRRSKWINKLIQNAALEAERALMEARRQCLKDEDIVEMVRGRVSCSSHWNLRGNELVAAMLEEWAS